MKRQTGIWIDGARAVIIVLIDGKEQVSEIEANIENKVYHDHEGDGGAFMGSQHVSGEKRFDERKKNQLDQFLKKVIAEIKKEDEIYVFGPSAVKISLRQMIEDEGMIEKLKAVDTADSMTKNQMIAKVKEAYGWLKRYPQGKR